MDHSMVKFFLLASLFEYCNSKKETVKLIIFNSKGGKNTHLNITYPRIQDKKNKIHMETVAGTSNSL